MKTTISVTLSHIKRGIGKNCRHCVLSLAINPHLRHPYRAEVWPDNGVGNVSITKGPYDVRIVALPYRADRFAERFDDVAGVRGGRAALKPFTFRLDIPKEMLRVGA